jgi:hypothetical protein
VRVALQADPRDAGAQVMVPAEESTAEALKVALRRPVAELDCALPLSRTHGNSSSTEMFRWYRPQL